MDIFALKHRFHFHSATSDMMIYEASYDEPRVEVSLILEGAVTFIVDGQRRHVEAPAITFQAYRKSLHVEVARDRRTRTMWCHFPSCILSDTEWDWLNSLPVAQAASDRITDLFNSALALPIDMSDGDDDAPDYVQGVRDALGNAIFAEYVRMARETNRQPIMPLPMLVAKRAVDEHYSKPWSVDDLAHIAGVNGNYLIHLFNKYLGDSPIRYVWTRRVEAGVHLLQTTNLSIDEISYRCGFQTAAHFSRRVKLQKGHPPSSLRQNRISSSQWMTTQKARHTNSLEAGSA